MAIVKQFSDVDVNVICVLLSVLFTAQWLCNCEIMCDLQLYLKDWGQYCMRHRSINEFSTW